MWTRLSVLVVAVTLAACASPTQPQPQPPTEQAKEAAVAQAKQATKALMSTLIGHLSDALDEGDTVAALNVCADMAQELTETIKAEQGIEIGRTSLLTRNPLNAPDEYERAWLEANAERTEFDPEGEVDWVTQEDGSVELRFLKPIRIGAACLQCHGQAEDIDDATRALLAERYPQDQATGYTDGQLRGVVSVRVPVQQGT